MKSFVPAGLSTGLVRIAQAAGLEVPFLALPGISDRVATMSEGGASLGPTHAYIEAVFADVTAESLAEALMESGISPFGDGTLPPLTITEIETDAGTLRTFVSGYYPIDQLLSLDSLLGDAGVTGQFLNASEGGFSTAVGTTTSQGDAAQQSDEARTNFGVDGSFVTVGVISDSFGFELGSDGVTPTATTVADDVASGDLPANVVVLQEGTAISSDGDEGRAMAQIIHDVAPGAALAFHTSNGGQGNFANGINRLANEAGSDVIVDDIIYFAEPIFQDGVIAQAAANFVTSGGVYLSSAGNNANDAFLDVFRGSGQDANTIPALAALLSDPTNPLGELHDWNDDPTVVAPYLELTVASGRDFSLSFQWDEPFASAGGSGSTSDLDIFITEVDGATETAVDFGVANNINSDAVEIVGVSTANEDKTYRIYITEFDAPDGVAANIIAGVFFLGGGRLVADYNPVVLGPGGTNIASTVVGAPTTFGHANAEGALAVGAAAWFNTPEFNAGLSAARLNSFSSQGGYNILFDAAGNRLASPDTRDSVDFVAPDGGNTTFFGSDTGADADAFPNFFGTSAAAPHAAAVVALLLDSVPNLTPAQIESLLEGSATAITQRSNGDTVDFFSTGAGLIDANIALANAQAFFVNTAPTANDDDFSIDENFGPTLVANVLADNGTGADFDVDNDTLTITAINGDSGSVGVSVALAGGASVTVASNGDLTVDTGTNYDSLQVGETASESFTYTVSDGAGGSATGSVTLLITGANDAPVAADDAFGLTQGDTDSALGNVLSDNGSGVDADPDDPSFTITAVNGSSDNIGLPITLANGVVVEIDAAGAVTATAGAATAALPQGATSGGTVNYTITDSGLSASSATVTVTVTGINDAPVAANDQVLTVAAATIPVINVLGNDSDIDAGDTLSLASFDATGVLGLLSDNGDGTLAYDPNGAFDGLAVGTSATETFTYVVEDVVGAQTQASVTLTVLAENRAPTAAADAVSVGENAVDVLIEPLSNDADLDVPLGDFLTLASIDTSLLIGELTDNGDGTLSYSAGVAFDDLADGVQATDTFTYTLEDGFGATATETVTITITGENDAPEALDDLETTSETGVLSGIDLLANDTDPDLGDAVSFVSIDTSTLLGTLIDNGDGTFDYDPGTAFRALGNGEIGTDSATYTIVDTNGAQTDGVLQIDITGIDNLAAVDDQASNIVGSTTVIDVLANDLFPGGTEIFIAGFDTSNTEGRITGFSLSGFSYQASSALAGLVDGATATDQFSYTVEDDAGDQQSADVALTLIGSAVATAGNDTLFGDSTANNFGGGDGNDLLFGDGVTDVDALLAGLGLSGGGSGTASNAGGAVFGSGLTTATALTEDPAAQAEADAAVALAAGDLFGEDSAPDVYDPVAIQ